MGKAITAPDLLSMREVQRDRRGMGLVPAGDTRAAAAALADLASDGHACSATRPRKPRSASVLLAHG